MFLMMPFVFRTASFDPDATQPGKTSEPHPGLPSTKPRVFKEMFRDRRL